MIVPVVAQMGIRDRSRRADKYSGVRLRGLFLCRDSSLSGELIREFLPVLGSLSKVCCLPHHHSLHALGTASSVFPGFLRHRNDYDKYASPGINDLPQLRDKLRHGDGELHAYLT